jgi:hypothetical protein
LFQEGSFDPDQCRRDVLGLPDIRFTATSSERFPSGRGQTLSVPGNLAQRMEVDVTNHRKFNAHVLSFALAAILTVGVWPPEVAAQVSFSEDVSPIIELRCLECHQPGAQGYEKSGLDLRTYEGLMKGTKHGPIVVPRSWLESSLNAVIDRRTSPEIWMPHKKKQLSKCERLAFRHWVMQGARNN